MKRIANAFGKPNRGKRAHAVLVLWAATGMALPAQTFTLLHTFDGKDGADPYAGLVQGTDGNLYGTTKAGGANTPLAIIAGGTVFKITPTGTLTTLYSFCSQGIPPNCTDGELPLAAPIQGTDGNLYGTTSAGGANCDQHDCGTIYKITPTGTLTTLYSFCAVGGVYCADGESPHAGLVQGTDGNFYGTTEFGGANNNSLCGSAGCGTVFKITPTGTLTTLYGFCTQSGCTDGVNPQAGLIQANDGNFYGTAEFGGANCADDGGCGTFFKITPTGTLTTLYSFCAQGLPNCPDGAYPNGLILATNGDFYGTTISGGSGIGGRGTIFAISPSGQLTTLYTFCPKGQCDAGPHAGLVQGNDGNFYGVTEQGGANGGGMVFKVTPRGTLTTLYSFCSPRSKTCPDGYKPWAGLVQATNGDFYGTTPLSGGVGIRPRPLGVIFSLSVGLGPFVETQPTSGRAGAPVQILGTDLTGATSVTFNGVAATFTVVSPSLITATVPTGATTGPVQVVTPSGTLSSNVPFQVR